VATTVLCLGESTTFVGGTSSYPSLLERELARRLPQRRVRVVNDGFPGGDSTTILPWVEQHLTSYQPVLVVAMMGINDKGDRVPFTGSALPSPKPQLRVARLAAYLERNLAQRASARSSAGPVRQTLTPIQLQAIDEAHRAASLGGADPFQAPFERALQLVPGSTLLQIEYAEAYLWNVPPPLGVARRFLPAKRLLEAVLLHSPHNARARLDLALGHFTSEEVSQGRHHLHLACLEPWDEVYLETDRAFFSLIYWLRKAPEPLVGARLEELCARNPLNPTYHSQTARYFADIGDTTRSERYRARADQLCRESYAPTTARSYQQLREILAREHTGLLCLQYAGRSVEPLRRLVGLHPGVWFADTQAELAQARQVHPYSDLFTDTCYGDLGHATALGNGLIAQKVADVIVGLQLYDRAIVQAAWGSSPPAPRGGAGVNEGQASR
jgi:hypothetical protein